MRWKTWAARAALSIIAGLTVATCTAGPPATQVKDLSAAGWPMYRADLQRDGRAPASTLDSHEASRLHLAWRAELGGPVDGSPVVADGLVFAGSERGWLGAFEPTSGAVAWLKKGLGSVTGTVAVGSGLVVVGDLAGRVTAFDVHDGRRVWTWTAPGIRPAIWSSPTIWQSTVLVATSSQSGDVPFEAGRLGSLDLRTGRQRWIECVRAGCQSGDGMWSTAAVDAAGRAFIGVGNPDDGVLAFDARTGKMLWLHSFYPDLDRDLDVGATPVLVTVGGREAVDVGSTAGIFESLAAADGSVVWSRRVDQGTAVHGLIGSPSSDGATIFQPSASPPTGIAALIGGSALWSVPTALPVYGSPALGDQVLITGTGAVFGDRSAGELLALSTEDGTILWRYNAGSAINSSPAIDGTLVLAGDFAGELLAFAAR